MKSLAGAFFAAVNLLYAAFFGGPIDGTAWDVKVKKEGLFHWTSRQETLIFHGGRVAIAGEVARGYSPALYEAKDEEGGTAFSLVLSGDGRDPVEWSGRVEGTRIRGMMVVRARDGKTLRYKFSGARKSG
ncbi:MAG: hypothetical protein A2506_07155 [Elusimicrobia bacterium RIFOXYD12_FULL_66_9]|nr:MAG: hypothetical protein A2506_07155 [Elusimicrobia bacterium RIFOXYD12_FULL_66_9]